MSGVCDCNSFQRGFTLLELLAIIVILALLAALIFNLSNPSLQSVVNKTKTSFSMAIARSDCEKANDLTADVGSVQTKINEMAKENPPYGSDKPAIQDIVDGFNKIISVYNNSCDVTIPLIVLP